MSCFRRTATGLNGALCMYWVEGGRRASLRRLLEKAMEWVAMVSCGAYKHRSATNSGWISIYSLRRVDRTGKLQAASRTASPSGPLRRRGRLHLKPPGGELRRYQSLRMNS